MRIVFLGTPEFAVPVLDALRAAGHEIAAVISQPDREKDKKGNVMATPVKQCAIRLGIPCLQFEKVSDHVSELIALAPDVLITAAYGQLLKQSVLEAAPFGVLNVHASLLPKYRGSSPIQSAILAGDTVTGVTIMKTDIGMDTGDILSVRRVPIAATDTSDSLSRKLAELGAALLTETLPLYAAGKIKPRKQAAEEATHCKKITKADGRIDWNRSAREIACRIRAYNPWPIAYSYLDGQPLKIYEAEECAAQGVPGTLHVSGDTLTVVCGDNGLRLLRVQLPGKKVLAATEFVRGRKNLQGTVLKNA